MRLGGASEAAVTVGSVWSAMKAEQARSSESAASAASRRAAKASRRAAKAERSRLCSRRGGEAWTWRAWRRWRACFKMMRVELEDKHFGEPPCSSGDPPRWDRRQGPGIEDGGTGMRAGTRPGRRWGPGPHPIFGIEDGGSRRGGSRGHECLGETLGGYRGESHGGRRGKARRGRGSGRRSRRRCPGDQNFRRAFAAGVLARQQGNFMRINLLKGIRICIKGIDRCTWNKWFASQHSSERISQLWGRAWGWKLRGEADQSGRGQTVCLSWMEARIPEDLVER